MSAVNSVPYSPNHSSEPVPGIPRRRGLFGRIGDLWCRLMHKDVMWPIHGYYQCRKCLRAYPVRFDEADENQRGKTR